MQKHIEDQLAIPAFLKVANRDKLKVKKNKVTVAKEEDAAVDPIAELHLEQETTELLRNEIRTGRFQPHWLSDPDTIRVFEREHQLRKAKKEAKAEDREVEKKIKRNERLAAQALKPEFGAGVRIIVLVREPKRQPGAARIPRFTSLLEYLDKNPNASVAEIFKNTQYLKSDFTRDQRLKIIKTDLIVKPVAKPTAKKGK